MFLDYSDNVAAHFGLSCGLVTSTPLFEYSPQTPCFVRFKSPVKNFELKPAERNLYEPILCAVERYEDPYFNVLMTSAFKEKKQTYSPVRRKNLGENFKRSLLVYRSIELDFPENEETIKAPNKSDDKHMFTKKPTHCSDGLNTILYSFSHCGSFKFLHNPSMRSRKTSRAHESRSRRRRSDDRRRKCIGSNSPSRNRSFRFRPRREILRLRNKRHRNYHRHLCKRRHEDNAPRYGDNYYRNEHKYVVKKDNKRYRSLTPRKHRH